VRLEVLEDQSLPTSGPGLFVDGNFELTEMTLEHREALGLTLGGSGSALRSVPPPR
jgi:hypothetical protein